MSKSNIILDTYLKNILPSIEQTGQYGSIQVIDKEENTRTLYFNTYEEAKGFIKKYGHNNNCYISLSTTKTNTNFEKENWSKRNVIVIDIDCHNTDEEMLELQDIYSLCKKMGLFAHIIVNSGRGWHLYFLLDKEYSAKQVIKVNKRIATLFNADIGAVNNNRARVPYTINTKANIKSSIVITNKPVEPYSLSYLNTFTPNEYKDSSTSTTMKLDKMYCVQQLIKNGTNEGTRNKIAFFIATSCKYAGLSENECIDELIEFNNNCKPPEKINKLKSVARSVYKNTAIISPCQLEEGQQLCNYRCPYKHENCNCIFAKPCNLLKSDKTFDLTEKHILGRTEKGGNRMTMLQALTGTEIAIIGLLKIVTSAMSQDDIVNYLKVSVPTIRTALNNLSKYGMVVRTAQQYGKGKKTLLYFYNSDYDQRYCKLMDVNTALIVAKAQKSINDNDFKVGIAMKYLAVTGQPITHLKISYLTGIEEKNLHRHIKKLDEANLLVKHKTGKSYKYELFY